MLTGPIPGSSEVKAGFGGEQPPTDSIARLKHRDGSPGSRQLASGVEARRTGTDHDNVGTESSGGARARGGSEVFEHSMRV